MAKLKKNYFLPLLYRCKFPLKCRPYLDFTKINANDRLDLIGSCLSGCTGQNITYKYILYEQQSPLSNTWTPFQLSQNFTRQGHNETELLIDKSLFETYSNRQLWKVEFITYVLTYKNESLRGSSSIFLYVNFPPAKGTCSISPKNGTTSTIFTVNCKKWTDDYDKVVRYYSFYGKFFVKSFLFY